MERTARHCPRTNGGHWLALDLMGTLKLYGMRSAYDEVMSAGIKRQHEPPRIVGDLLQSEIAEVRRAPPLVRGHAEQHDPSAIN